MGVVDASPLPPAEGRQRAHKQVGELALTASNGLRFGGSTHGYTSWICTERRRMSMRAYDTAEAG
jgi:hypothetical protein